MESVKVTKRGADRVRRGHLWIYKSDVVDTVGVVAGSIVVVLDPRGNFVGQALYSSASEIALRLLTKSRETIDREWWRARIHAAAARREHLKSQTNAYR